MIGTGIEIITEETFIHENDIVIVTVVTEGMIEIEIGIEIENEIDQKRVSQMSK